MLLNLLRSASNNVYHPPDRLNRFLLLHLHSSCYYLSNVARVQTRRMGSIMNIFVLSSSPGSAAMQMCDQHVVSQIKESMQMLSTAIRSKELPINFSGLSIIKSTHDNHPCNLWIRSEPGAFCWLVQHALALCREYTHRRYRRHAYDSMIKAIWDRCHSHATLLVDPPPCAMDDDCRVGDCSTWSLVVASYRKYYQRKRDTLERFTYTNREWPNWLKHDS